MNLYAYALTTILASIATLAAPPMSPNNEFTFAETKKRTLEARGYVKPIFHFKTKKGETRATIKEIYIVTPTDWVKSK